LADEERLPEVRSVEPGQVLRLCRCGQCASLPDATDACSYMLELTVGASVIYCCAVAGYRHGYRSATVPTRPLHRV